jgi:adenylate cyclase
LVVDDERENLDLLYRIFRRDYQVLRAESGAVALDVLQDNPDVAIVISDQQMPGINGLTFLCEVAVHYPDTVRVLLTGYTEVDNLDEAIDSGKIFKYVTKPWNAKELKAVIECAIAPQD